MCIKYYVSVYFEASKRYFYVQSQPFTGNYPELWSEKTDREKYKSMKSMKLDSSKRQGESALNPQHFGSLGQINALGPKLIG